MNSILSDLFMKHHELFTQVNKSNPEIMYEIANARERFTSKLSPAQDEMYHELEELKVERASIERENLMMNMFSLGALMIIEIMNSDIADLFND